MNRLEVKSIIAFREASETDQDSCDCSRFQNPMIKHAPYEKEKGILSRTNSYILETHRIPEKMKFLQ